MKVQSQTPLAATHSDARSSAAAPQGDSALKKHVDFFDRNHDGITTLPETYQGLRALGLGRVLSGAGAVFINLGLGAKTDEPFYKLTINNSKIHQAKHDSDSDTYDNQGQFVQAKLDNMFTVHDTNQDAALNKAEIQAMLERNKESKVGKIASGAEFNLLLKVAGQPDASGEKVLTRQRMQEFYEGTLFYSIEKEHQQRA